jgi:hypothetical protein
VDYDLARRAVCGDCRQHRAAWRTQEGTHLLDQDAALSHARLRLSTPTAGCNARPGLGQP